MADITPVRRARIQRILDAVDTRHDHKQADVQLLWGELRGLFEAVTERDYWHSRALALEHERRAFLLDHGIDLGERPALKEPTPHG